MKVTLTKETAIDGTIRFYIHADGKVVESFGLSFEKEAKEYFDKYGENEPKIEVLETKEV